MNAVTPIVDVDEWIDYDEVAKILLLSPQSLDHINRGLLSKCIRRRRVSVWGRPWVYSIRDTQRVLSVRLRCRIGAHQALRVVAALKEGPL